MTTQTIEKCKELILSKSIDINIHYSSNINLIEAFTRMIRTIYIWCTIIAIFYTKVFCEFRPFIIVLISSILLYIISAILISWVKFNFKQAYDNMKVNLVKALVENCTELEEMDCPEWEKLQIAKSMAALGEVDIVPNNNDK